MSIDFCYIFVLIFSRSHESLAILPIVTLTKESTTKSHGNTLVLSVVGQSSLTQFTTNTRLLETTERPVYIKLAFCKSKPNFDEGKRTIGERACCSL